LFRCCISRDVKVFGMGTEEQISDGAAHNIGLEACLAKLVDYPDRSRANQRRVNAMFRLGDGSQGVPSRKSSSRGVYYLRRLTCALGSQQSKRETKNKHGEVSFPIQVRLHFLLFLGHLLLFRLYPVVCR